MILIIGDIEIYDFLPSTIVNLHIFKTQAAILHAIVSLDSNLSTILQLSRITTATITDRELDNPLELICGYTGFHSSFLKDIYRCCCDYNVDPLRLIMAYSKIDKENIDKGKLAEVAKCLPKDNVDDHPYNFRKYFTYNV